MTQTFDSTALATLNSLEDRIEKIEWYLSGSNEAADVLQHVVDQGRDNTVKARLGRLESNLDRLTVRSPVLDSLLKLYATYPDLFQPSNPNIPTTLSTAKVLAIITSCATSFPTTASRLNAIKDLPIPSAGFSASLIALQPRLARLRKLQSSQGQEMAELRAKTASAIQRWYELRVLGESECWNEWEESLIAVEKRVRREEMDKVKEDRERQAYRS